MCPPLEPRNVFAALEEGNVREIGALPNSTSFDEMPHSATSPAQPVGVSCRDTGVCHALHTRDFKQETDWSGIFSASLIIDTTQ